MIDLLITILILNFFTICFKWYEKYGVHNVTAIIINYLTAGILGFILSDKTKLNLSEGVNDDLINILIFSSLIGGLFIVVFNLIAYSTQKTGIAKTVLVSKIASIILPVSFAIAFTSESASTIKIVALTLSVISLFFIFNFKNNTLSKISILILVGIFIGQGSADILFDLSESIIDNDYSSLYFAFIFTLAGVFGLIFSLFNKKQRFQFNLKNIFFGVLLGIPNYFSLHFFFNALSKIDSSIAFPVLNIGIILLSTLAGVVFFKEHLSRKNIIGIAIASVSLYLITL